MDAHAMDVEGLVGQLFTVDFSGPEPSAEVERLIRDAGVGGVVLFDKNIVEPGQVARLTNALQRLAADAGRPPLLVSIDQEGGRVTHLRGTHFPSPMAFGAAADEGLTTQAAEVTARELRATGVHFNFAPSLDVNSNPANPVIGTRSYGEDPALVARLGVRAIAGMQAAGVLATAKHFPGHGDTALDSHLALPIVAERRDRLDAVELLPFREAIRAGVGAVMTAHVIYSALDPDHPATLSASIIALLRGELGFGGLVVTDSMGMRAITDRYRPGAAAVQAVRAGIDVVLALGAVEGQWEALAAVRDAVRDGLIPAARIRDAAERILAAKRRLGLFEHALVSEADAVAFTGRPAHLALADRVAAAAATLVTPRDGSIPLPAGPVSVVGGAAPEAIVHRLADALRAAGRPATAMTLDPDIASGGSVRAQGAYVVPIAGASPRVHEVTRTASELGPTAAVAVDIPYPLAAVARGCARLAVYGADPASLKAAAAVLAGMFPARGRLPVTV